MQMHNLTIHKLGAALAVLVASVLAACGGAADSTKDTLPPTLVISSLATSETARGPLTLLFTFSEDVGSSFSIESIFASGGTVDTFIKQDATHYKVQLSPPSNAKGAASVSVPASRYKDLSNNWNTAAAVLPINYDTTPELTATSGNTGSCASSSTLTCLDMEPGATTALAPFGRLVAAFAADPSNPQNRVVQLVKNIGSEVWAGATLGASGTLKVSPVTMGANRVLTLRVYAPAAGEKFMLKLENKASNNTVFVSAEAKTTKAGAWETLSFDFDNPTEGTSYNFKTTYDMVSVFPHYGQPVSGTTTFYIDELKLKTEDRLAGLPSGEIDIMEQKGFGAADKREVSAYLHHSGGDPGNLTSLTDACTSFHNYQLTWTPEKIVIAVDDFKYFEYTNPKDGNFANWPYSGPQYLILNVAMGGALGGSIPASFVSDQMEVDYVRVYQRQAN